MSQLKQLASHTAIYGLGHILSKGFYFVFLVPYLTRRLDDTYSFGVYNELYGYASLLIVLFSFRMDTALFRFGSKVDSLQKAFSSALIPVLLGGIGLALLIYFGADTIASWIKYPDKAFYVQWFAVIIALDVLVLLPYARLRLENKALKFTIYRLLNIFITIFLVFTFLEYDITTRYHWIPLLEDIEYVFLSNLIASVLMAILFLPVLLKASLKNIDWSLIKRMLWYCAPLVIVGMSNSINQFFAVPLQKFFLGGNYTENLSDGGIYAAPQKIAALVSLVTVAFNYAAEPFFFKHAVNSNDRSVYGKIALAFTLFMGVIVVGIICYIDILKYLTDVSKYSEGFVIVPILLFAYLLLGLYYNISIWYKLSDKTHFGAYISLSGVLLTLVLSILLLPSIGYIGSAWAALGCYGLMVSLAYLLGQKYYPIEYPIKSIGIQIILTVAFVIIALLVNAQQFTMALLIGINTIVLSLYLTSSYLMNKSFVQEQIQESRS